VVRWVAFSVVALVGGHLTDLKNMAVCQEWRGNKYKNACRKAWKIVSHINKL
jgi:hypothetical protein